MTDRPVVSPADQENVHPNVPPLAEALSNVRDDARVARAAHIDRSAKETGKRKRGPRNSDAAKIEALLSHVDGAETAFQLAEDVVRYLSAIKNAPPSLGLAIEALKLVASAGRQQVEAMRSEVNNTKAKQRSIQAHRKLTSVRECQLSAQRLQSRDLSR